MRDYQKIEKKLELMSINNENPNENYLKNEDWFIDCEFPDLDEQDFKNGRNQKEEQLKDSQKNQYKWKKKIDIISINNESPNENYLKNEDCFIDCEFPDLEEQDFKNETNPKEEQIKGKKINCASSKPTKTLPKKITKDVKKAGKFVKSRRRINSKLNHNENKKEIELLHKLNIYYKNFFPFLEIYRWLDYGGRGKIEYREFACALVINNVFARNITFPNRGTMMRFFLAELPIKIDIGARFHTNPQDSARHEVNLRHAERELVFDIDLSDYDNVRTCCSETNICQKCWKLAAFACKILDASFREDFGWNHIVWVFSGRRGIHAWVCDRKARLLSSQERQDVVAFYAISSGNIAKRPELRMEFLHPHIKRSYAIAVPTFVSTCVREQNILGTDRGVEIFLLLIPAGSYRENVKESLLSESTSISRWAKFFAYYKHQKKKETEEWKLRPHLLQEIVLFYTYPRLDLDVTTNPRHLLKAPFSLHPKTFKVCLPIDPTRVDEFCVTEVPSLDDLVDSILKNETSPNVEENPKTLSKYCKYSEENDNSFCEIIEDHRMSIDASQESEDSDVIIIEDHKMSIDESEDSEDSDVMIIEDETLLSKFENSEDSVETIKTEKNLPKVVSTAWVQKEKYKNSVKFFAAFVDTMASSLE